MMARALASSGVKAANKFAPANAVLLPRQCACGQHTIGGAPCSVCRGEHGFADLSQRSQQARTGREGRASGSCPPGEMGSTGCNFTNGELFTKVNCEHKLGNCVELHENVHKADPFMAASCRGAAACYARDDGGVDRAELDPSFPESDLPSLCATTFNRWAEAHRPSTEANAYRAEVACLQQTQDHSCGAAQARDRNIGGAITGAVLGAGGIAGGAAAGAHFLPKVTSLSPTAGGVLGGILGSSLGAVGYGLGRLIGGALGPSQGSQEECDDVADALKDADKNATSWGGMKPKPVPVPFAPDGRVMHKTWLHGLLKSDATKPPPGPRGPQSQSPSKPDGESAPIATRAPIGGSRGAAHRRVDLTRVPPRASAPSALPSVVHEVMRSPGAPLDATSRRFMQARLNHDFSAVRLHTGAEAAQAARALDARAYTVGPHIVFDDGQYAPHNPGGRALLAHELAHTIQQGEGALPERLRADSPHSSHEAEADRAAKLAASEEHRGARAHVSTGVAQGLVQRLSGAAVGGIVAGVVGAAAIGGIIASLVLGRRRLMHWETNVADAELVDDPASTPSTSTVLLPQNTRVTIIDEGAGRSFNASGPIWVKVRVTVGPFLNREGWVRRANLESRPETEEISPEQAREIFTAVSQANILTDDGMTPIPFHYPPDGCYARAHRVEELLTEMGYASEKVFALAGSRPLRVRSPYADNPQLGQAGEPAPNVTWAWHVAPIIRVRDPQRGLVETVIDPSMAGVPISLADWETLMTEGDTSSSTFTRLSLSEARDVMQRHELGRYARVAVTAERYTYGPDDLQRDETHEEAQAEDAGVRGRITAYAHLVPAFELARKIRAELARAVINLTAIINAIKAVTSQVRQMFVHRFTRLIALLHQRLQPNQAGQVDSELSR
jgi:hypothetical protein